MTHIITVEEKTKTTDCTLCRECCGGHRADAESERSEKETAVAGARVWSGERSEWIGKQINRPSSWIILK